MIQALILKWRPYNPPVPVDSCLLYEYMSRIYAHTIKETSCRSCSAIYRNIFFTFSIETFHSSLSNGGGGGWYITMITPRTYATDIKEYILLFSACLFILFQPILILLKNSNSLTLHLFPPHFVKPEFKNSVVSVFGISIHLECQVFEWSVFNLLCLLEETGARKYL